MTWLYLVNVRKLSCLAHGTSHCVYFFGLADKGVDDGFHVGGFSAKLIAKWWRSKVIKKAATRTTTAKGEEERLMFSIRYYSNSKTYVLGSKRNVADVTRYFRDFLCIR